MNRSKIESSFKRELLRLKWIGNITRQLTPLPPHAKKKERARAQAGRGLSGVHLLFFHFKFQFSE